MAVIDVTMDTAGVERGSFILSDQLDKVSDRIKELSSVQNQYNASGVQVGATIKGLTKDGKEFTATLGVMTKAERDLAAAGNDVALGLKKINYKETKKDTEDLATSTSKLREYTDKLGTSLRYFATYKAFNFIADGLRDGVKEANKLQIEISKIRTITQGGEQQTQKKFGEDIRGVSDRTGVDVNEIAKAFYDTTSNQVARGKEAAAFVQTAAELARVTGSSTTDTVNLLSSRINAFGLNAKDADKIAAEFFRTIDEGRVVAAELASTIGRTDVLASNLGIAFQDVDATLAITTQKGFKTSDAMTLLTNLMIKLEKPTEATSRFFKSIGAESGEAAVKIAGGMIPLLRLIVDQTKAGILPVSAFFDEIRGRKQFGVFEQSIDEIEAFSKKLKDVSATVQQYQNAVEIRGESPADKLNKEINKLSNVFKVDLGQEVLKQAAAFVEWAGGADNVTQNSKTLVEVLKVGAVVFATYGVVVLGVAGYNYVAAVSFTALGVAARSAIALMAPFLIAYASFKVTQLALKQLGAEGTQQFTFLDVDPSALRETANSIAEVKKNYEEFKKAQAGQKIDPFAGFEESAKKASEAYKDLQGIIAKAITINDGALDSAKAKSKETADAMKVNFSTWADTIRNRVSDFKKQVTDANSEIEKSKKAILGFKETLDEILFQTRLKYANDDDRFGNQKQQLTQEKIGSLRARGRELFETGTAEGADQGRKLFAEAAKLQADLKDLKVEREKDRLEKFGGPGEKTLIVDTNDLLRDQIELKKELDALEEKYRARKKNDKDVYGSNAKNEEEKLKKLIQDFDRYNKIDIFNKDGSISADFKTDGKFDRKKLDTALSKEEKAIRQDGPTDYKERLAIEMGFLERRRALYKEADLAETSDALKTEQQKNLAKEEEFKKNLEKIKAGRQKLQSDQEGGFELFNQLPKTLAAFTDILAKSGNLKESGEETKELLAALTKAREASVRLENNKINVGGVLAYDPARIEEATKANKDALDTLLRIRDKVSPETSLTLRDDQGQEITPGGVKSALDLGANKLRGNTQGLSKNVKDEENLKAEFQKTVKEPLDKLKALFPELAKAGTQFTDTLNTGLKKNDEGLDNLIRKLERVNELMKQAPAPKVGVLGGVGDDQAALTDTIGEVYAATGGIAGLFPGQPRGQDMYPIWAARGEVIINARSAAMYKPMLEAIQSRRQPQYMAAGGRVGGDTNVGDITVNVNGGSTDSQTGRNIGKGLERGIRRGTIRLNPRRNS